ncbi:13599_t:CDS:1, partial [Racocetra fulgida]
GTNITSQVDSSDIGKVTFHETTHNPQNSPYVIGNYLTRCQEQESAWLFVYDIKAEKKVTDENVLKRVSLYNW